MQPWKIEPVSFLLKKVHGNAAVLKDHAEDKRYSKNPGPIPLFQPGSAMEDEDNELDESARLIDEAVCLHAERHGCPVEKRDCIDACKGYHPWKIPFHQENTMVFSLDETQQHKRCDKGDDGEPCHLLKRRHNIVDRRVQHAEPDKPDEE